MGKSGKVADISTVLEWDDIDLLRGENFLQLVQERQKLKSKLDAMEKQVKDLNGQIEVLLVAAKKDKIKADKWLVMRTGGRSASQISAQLLVQKGVDADVIAECTIPGTAYYQIRVEDLSRKEAKDGTS